MVATFVLTISVLRLPRLTREALAILSLQVKLGDSYAIVVFLGGETFDGEVATLGCILEVEGLPAVAGLRGDDARWRCSGNGGGGRRRGELR